MVPSIGLCDAGCCGSFYLEVALRLLGVPYWVFGRQDVPGPDIEKCSVLVFGAGGLYPSRTALGGRAGKQRLRAMIAEGRTFVGFCAGAYLALDVRLGLGLCDVPLDVPFDVTMAGRIHQGFLNVDTARGAMRLWHQNGPVFPRSLPAEAVVASYADSQDVSPASLTNCLTSTEMAGRPAIVRVPCGQGRCILLSPP